MKTSKLLSMLPVIPPTEFRIFKRGWNETAKGRLLFDDTAAKEIMKEFATRGRDYPIDLEHLSLDTESKAFDPDSRGWFKLQLRNGELWAVDVRWTPDGDRRLREGTQRYISPFLVYDENTGRVVSLFNVAICASPATYDTPALVAASLRSGKKFGTLSIEANKNMEELKKICQKLGLEDSATLEECLSAIDTLQSDEGEEGGGDSKEEMADDEGSDDKSKDDDKKEEKEGDEPPKEDKALSALPAEARGLIMALQHNVAVLTKQLSGVVKKTTKDEVRELVKENTNKIPLHLEEWALSQEPAALRAFLKHAISQPRKSTEKKIESGAITLTDGERAAGKEAKLTDEQMLASKKRLKEKAQTQQN